MSAADRREVIERAATELFAERGYHGASIDEIARRSGVSAPVVYDHFESKQALHTRLLERHRDQLLEVWREHLLASDPPEQRIPRALDAWARYVEGHPFAWMMLFRETTGEPEVQAEHRRVQAEARASLAPLLAAQPGADRIAVDPRGAGDGGRADPLRPDRPRALVARAPRGPARADRRHGDERALDRLRAARPRRAVGLEEPHREREDDQRHPDEQREDDPDAECL